MHYTDKYSQQSSIIWKIGKFSWTVECLFMNLNAVAASENKLNFANAFIK